MDHLEQGESAYNAEYVCGGITGADGSAVDESLGGFKGQGQPRQQGQSKPDPVMQKGKQGQSDHKKTAPMGIDISPIGEGNRGMGVKCTRKQGKQEDQGYPPSPALKMEQSSHGSGTFRLFFF
jgi:hypothetical protein